MTLSDRPAPLVVTLRMEKAVAARFTALRRAHFPAGRNWLDAHITLFHALPGAAQDTVLADVKDVAAATPPCTMRTARLLLLGGGVAFAIESVEMTTLRRVLAQRWDGLLGRQDRAWRGPLHITVQNKVAPAAARALHDTLGEGFAPEPVLATGIEVWHYVGGPWRLVESFAFAGEVPT